MQCTCGTQAIIDDPPRCKPCFLQQFEQRFFDTIERFGLVEEGERICLAASGGKDSLATAHLLSKRYSFDVLAVDEGIAGYREHTLEDLRTFCEERGLTLRIVSFADVGGQPLDELQPKNPCGVCGMFRRKALLEYSKEYDVLITGHNLDDECQTIVMNLLRNNVSLLSRIGPRQERKEGIAARAKPLYLTPERDVRAYCILTGLDARFVECPNIGENFRWKVNEALDALDVAVPGAKRRVVEEFLERKEAGAFMNG